MKETKALIFGSVVLLGAIGCSSGDNYTRDYAYDSRTGANPVRESAGDTTRRDTRVIRAEERTVDSQNWRQAKALLSREGYRPGSVDPVVDQQTRDAIAAYQRRNKINATGLLDSRTLIYMQRDGAGFTGTLGAQLEKADGDPTLGED